MNLTGLDGPAERAKNNLSKPGGVSRRLRCICRAGLFDLDCPSTLRRDVQCGEASLRHHDSGASGISDEVCCQIDFPTRGVEHVDDKVAGTGATCRHDGHASPHVERPNSLRSSACECDRIRVGSGHFVWATRRYRRLNCGPGCRYGRDRCRWWGRCCRGRWWGAGCRRVRFRRAGRRSRGNDGRPTKRRLTLNAHYNALQRLSSEGEHTAFGRALCASLRCSALGGQDDS